MSEVAISIRNSSVSVAGVFCSVLLCSALAACQQPSSPKSPTAKAQAVPLAKPHSKLGPLLASLKRESSLIDEARAAGLKPTRDGLLVQLAYEGTSGPIEAALADLGLATLHHYPRYQRLDVLVRDYTELDALTGIGGVFRVQAMQTAVSR